MENIVIIIHIVMAVVIVGLVLLQQGKGADAGASFGAGASQTVFGSSGSGNFLVRATTVAATVFFITSLALAIFARNNAGLGPSTDALPEAVDGLPVQSADDDLPQLLPGELAAEDDAADTSGDDLPSLPDNDD